MKIKSFAKINLSLDITNKLDDGFHLLDMINVSVSLKDIITVKFTHKNNDIVISCNNPDVPTNNTNSIYKVIEKFRKTFKLEFGVKVYIKKMIPLQSGLGGGSSNASSMLLLLNNKFKTNMSLNEMIDFIKDITSDGPFSLYTKPARVQGKGEIVLPLKDICFNKNIFLVKPNSGCNTKEIFTKYDDKNNNSVDTIKVIEGLKTNNVDLLTISCNNALKDSIIATNHDIEHCLNSLKQCGFDVVGISGSGSTCFGISKNKKVYKNAKKVFGKENFDLNDYYKIIL